jgi:hypothetical protein
MFGQIILLLGHVEVGVAKARAEDLQGGRILSRQGAIGMQMTTGLGGMVWYLTCQMVRESHRSGGSAVGAEARARRGIERGMTEEGDAREHRLDETRTGGEAGAVTETDAHGKDLSGMTVTGSPIRVCLCWFCVTLNASALILDTMILDVAFHSSLF